MRKVIVSCFVLVAALAQPGCLVADTDCESDSDCKPGRSCSDGACVDGDGFGGSGGSGGSGGEGGGSGGGSQSFADCYECANTLCTEERTACNQNSEDVTNCYSLLKCMDNCSTAQCSSNCSGFWANASYPTYQLDQCVRGSCPICTNTG